MPYLTKAAFRIKGMSGSTHDHMGYLYTNDSISLPLFEEAVLLDLMNRAFTLIMVAETYVNDEPLNDLSFHILDSDEEFSCLMFLGSEEEVDGKMVMLYTISDSPLKWQQVNIKQAHLTPVRSLKLQKTKVHAYIQADGNLLTLVEMEGHEPVLLHTPVPGGLLLH